MKRMIFHVRVDDAIKLFDSCDLVKIVLMADGGFKIMDANIEYKPISQIYCICLSSDEYKRCNRDVKRFTEWLNRNKIGTDTVDINEQNEPVPKYEITTFWWYSFFCRK